MIGNDKYQFRLTAGAQKALEKRFDATGLQLILESAADAEKMTAILGASANYKDNENPTIDGEMIYDLLPVKMGSSKFRWASPWPPAS